MTTTPLINVTELRGVAVGNGAPSQVQVTELYPMGVVNYPARNINATQLYGQVVDRQMADIQVTEVYGVAVVRGRIDSTYLKAWTFNQDGHDFYIIRLGKDRTLVTDVANPGKWYEWVSPDTSVWRLQCGVNWHGRVIGGDDQTGILWHVDPDKGTDQDFNGNEISFDRKVTGFVPQKMRTTSAVGAVYLSASIGSPQLTGANITLRTSDDLGKTWTSHRTITAESGSYNQEYVWRSLGLIRSPGKVFELTDNGASVRLDGLDMR